MAKIDYVQAVDAVSVKPVKEMTAPVLVAMAEMCIRDRCNTLLYTQCDL